MSRKFEVPTVWLALLCLLGVSFLGAGCESKSTPAKSEVIRPIKGLVVQGHRDTVVKRYLGKVTASRKAEISFRVAGRLIELLVVEGQQVSKGQVVARLDPRDFAIRRDKAKAAFEKARQNYKRYKTLVTTRAISQAAFESAVANYRTAKAVYEEAEAALNDTWLRAPFAGVVTKRYVENHQDIKAKDPVLYIQDLRRLEVEAQIPERDALAFKQEPGLELVVRLDALPNEEMLATLSEFSAQADAVSQTYTLRVVFEQPEGKNILPGMTAELLVKRRSVSSDQTIRVPLAAVFVDAAGKNSVWKIDPGQMRAYKVEVSLAGLDKGLAIITHGLKPGETIATAGVHYLREGMPVRLMSDQPGDAIK